MLRKIKKYKISVRLHQALKNVKKDLAAQALPETAEKLVADEIRRTENLILPSSLYNTFSRNETPDTLQPLWQNTSAESLSLSLLATTVGEPLEKELQNLGGRGGINERMGTAILNAIGREAVTESLHFLIRLISDEAKSEGCELSSPIPVEPGLIRDALTVLECHKAGIALDGDERLAPVFSSVSFCFWNPISKSKSARNR